MTTWLVFLSVLLLISIAALPVTVWLMSWQQTVAVERVTAAASSAISALATVSNRQAELLDKSFAIVATKDPMAYQAVQAMNGYATQYHEAYDPSDEAEIERMKQLRNEENDGDEQLDPADEREYLAAIGVPVDNV